MDQEGREPACVLSGPITQAPRRDQRFSEIASTMGLYEATAELPQRQSGPIEPRCVLKYSAGRAARHLGLTGAAVDYCTDDAKDRPLLHIESARRALSAGSREGQGAARTR
ncbi:hypothetical protein [Streptomyces scopuliridis]|uniref:hypothetical protein n=1 Tax=Streptomyces scopuliridis TaxID=452529 RepID=UPI00342F859F